MDSYNGPSPSAGKAGGSREAIRGDGWPVETETYVMPEIAPMGSGCSEAGDRSVVTAPDPLKSEYGGERK